ncbi:hypothetical protein RJ640_017671 [Escallonia rubra]|uniref:NPH3 domain-containing protein n=1 Tax=Escallonia rubra TaxID=112253 RepID=A0AA88UPA4_9ASTE|nr:hypothetical protein RJ640_017671 [Escallonia rubra]
MLNDLEAEAPIDPFQFSGIFLGTTIRHEVKRGPTHLQAPISCCRLIALALEVYKQTEQCLQALVRNSHLRILSVSKITVSNYQGSPTVLPMVSRSAYINRLVFQRSSGQTSLNIWLDNLPGGCKCFELVVQFCYGERVELTAVNIAPLYCAAHFLEMSDDLQPGNLICRTETFLSFLILSSWKDTFRILRSCESISSWAKELQILKRCSEAIAWRSCMGPNAIKSSKKEVQCLNFLAEKGHNTNEEKVSDNWWFKDISFLRIDHFVEVIASIKRNGTRSELIGSCIAHWTGKWLSRIRLEYEYPTQKHQLPRVTIESLINLLPEEQKSVSFNFLLHLFKVGLILKVDAEILNKLERRIAFMLEGCRAQDLLVKNYGHGSTVYDVDIVVKMVEAYVSFLSDNFSSKIHAVGRLVDEYLMLVARNESLQASAHPSVTNEERSDICRVLEYQKLSQDAREHAMKNYRLPLNMTTRFFLLEHLNTTRSITATGSIYHHAKSQAISRVNKLLEKGWLNSQKEIKMLEQDVETIRGQLCQLQLCRAGLQKQVGMLTSYGSYQMTDDEIVNMST